VLPLLEQRCAAASTLLLQSTSTGLPVITLLLEQDYLMGGLEP